jgi:3-oxoacyl-[acyl-carrier protein] reductase/pteridine reductase
MGRAMAIEFAKKGWNIGLHYNSSEEKANETESLIKDLGVKCYKVKFDVRDFSAYKRGFQNIVEKLGVPNVFINNAGVFPKRKSLDNIELSDWDDTLNINLRGEFYGAKIFSEYAESGAKIINIASLGALEVWKNRIPYNVSKAGIIQLTKALARELAPKISVNCICPGTIVMPGEAAADSSEIDVQKIPMSRYGNTQDIFDAVYFFAECSPFITGQIINVDGGYHLSR